MAIILEGPDASGKTTLGRRLRDECNFELVIAGGAPSNRETLRVYCEKQASFLDRRDAIMDRFSPISHPVYNLEFDGDPELKHYMEMAMSHPETLIIYCRPPIDVMMMPEKHEWKDWDTEDHKQKVLTRQMEFIQSYDKLFERIPHIGYDYTNVPSREYLFDLLCDSAQSTEILKRLHRLASRFWVPA